MSNTIVFKVSFDDNTHRFSLEREGLTIQKLNATLVDIFGPSASRCNLKYEDNDGDIITLKSDFDLKEAINVFSDSQRVVIRLQLTPRRPKRLGRCPMRRQKGNENSESNIESPVNSDEEKNSNDEAIHELKKIGSKFESCIKDFVEGLNNGDAKKYFEELSEKGFMNRWFRRGFFPVPPQEPITVNKPEQSSEQSSEQSPEQSQKGSFAPGPRFGRLFGHCFGRLQDINISVSQQGTKKWKIKNHSPFVWPAGCILTYCGGDKIAAKEGFTTEKEVNPKEEIEIEFSFIAPSTPGKYVSYYRLVTPQGVLFGRKMRLSLNVEEEHRQEEGQEECIVEDVVVQENSTTVEQEEPKPEEPKQEEAEEQNEGDGLYADLIKQLNDMGFKDNSLSLDILERCGGDLMAAVDKLLSWN